ncbi:MAG: LEA type 2 family protein [Candidatus Cryptobacteroides sp.]
MRKWLLVAAAALCMMMAAGCGKMNEIRPTSFKLTEITPRGLRGIKAGALIGVYNPSSTFTLTDISGSIYYKGTRYADFTADPVTVKKKSSGEYDVRVEARLADGVSLLEALSIANNYRKIDKSQVKFDVDARVKAKGMKKKIQLRQVALDRIYR